MKVLVLAPQPFFQNRGTPIAVRSLLEVLAAEGHQLDVLTYHEGEDVEIPNCAIHRTAKPPGVSGIRPGPSWKKIVVDVFMLIKLLRMASRKRWDLIHAVEESVFMAMIVKRLFGIPYVYDMDSCLSLQLAEKYTWLRPVAGVFRFFERRAVRGSEGVIAVCKSLEDQAVAYSPRTPVVRVEDISLLETDGDAEDFESDVLEGSGPVIMYVGNLEAYQGIDLMLESFVHVYHCRRDARPDRNRRRPARRETIPAAGPRVWGRRPRTLPRAATGASTWPIPAAGRRVGITSGQRQQHADEDLLVSRFG